MGQMIEAALIAQQFQLEDLALRNIVCDVTKCRPSIHLEAGHGNLDVGELPVLAALF
jgi:hypothetical protein